MTTSDIVLVVGIFVMVVVTQTGLKPFDRRRIVLPLAVVGGIGAGYVRKLPSGQDNLLLAVAIGVLGVLFGLAAVALVRTERDAGGQRYTRAGLGYVLVWVVAMGGRLLFGYGAQHWYTVSLGRFMAGHHLSTDVWAPAFALMAMTMVATRTLVLFARFAMRSDAPLEPSAASARVAGPARIGLPR